MKLKTLFISLLCTIALHAQDVKKEQDQIKTKMEAFTSKTGTITKFVDKELTPIKTTYETIKTRIRKISSGQTSAYFYQITKPGKYSDVVGSIEYSDLLEVLKALKVLKSEVTGDMSSQDYLENKFITVDGFQVGYYINKGKATWYAKLEKYGSDNTIFIDNGDMLEQAFTEARTKIEEIKSN